MMWMVLTILLLSPWRLAVAQHCTPSYTKTNFKLQGHLIKSLTISENVQCLDECEFHGKCHSINFYLDIRICELNDANHLSSPESLVYSHGSKYTKYHERPVSKCSNKLCSEPLVCEMLDDGVDYKCRCRAFEALNFPRKSNKDYVVLENAFGSVTALTVALWVQADPSTSDHTPFSYATQSSYNEIVLYPNINPVKSEIYMGGSTYKNIPNTVIDGKWHHLCVTWENAQGNLKVYVDGILAKSLLAVKIGRVISKGAIVLGQDQDSYKGGFQSHQSFQGNLTSVNMWDKVLTSQEISVLAKSCRDEAVGNIVKWSDLKDKGEGAVKLFTSSS